MKNLPVLLALLCSGPLFGQIKFNLTYVPETGVYTVGILPEASWPAPKNTVGAAQIVLRAAAGVEFTPNVVSLIPGLVWADNAYVVQPAAAPGHDFVCISLASGPTTQIPMIAGQEVALFTFTNAGGGCAGLVELVTNDDPMVLAVRDGGINVTQNFAVLGARGNAFAGVDHGSADCTPTSGNVEAAEKFIESVQVSPVPADQEVTIRWILLNDYREHLDLVITDHLGREIQREKVTGAKGEQAQKLVVKHWPAGIYRINFQFSGGRRTQAWNLVVVH